MSRRIRFSEKSAKVQKEAPVKKYGDNDLNEDTIRENQRDCVSRKSSSRSQIKGGKNNKHKKNKLQKGGKNNSHEKNKLQKGGEIENKWKERNQFSSIITAKDEIISRSSIERNRASSKNISEHIETIPPGISITIMSDRTSKETMLPSISINFYGIEQQQWDKQSILRKGLESNIEKTLEQPISEKEKNGSLEQIKRVFSEETIRVFTRCFYQIIGLVVQICIWLLVVLLISHTVK